MLKYSFYRYDYYLQISTDPNFLSMNDHQFFFEEFLEKKADAFTALPQSGSSRINYIAKSADKNYVVTYNNNLRENEAFFYFSTIFHHLKLNTPQVLKINPEKNLYVQEFLGQKTLSEIITAEGLTPNVENLIKKSLEKLYNLQTKSLGKIDFSKSFEYEAYDNLPIIHDLYYFKNFLVDILEIEYHKSTLLKEFKNIASHIEKITPKVIMLRDFQSRNILVNEQGDVFFIDYQSAMEGPAAYDVISLLYQAKANFPQHFQESMLNYYLSFWDNEHDRKNIKDSFCWIQMMRFLQVLGAYGLRGIIQKKSHFLKSLEKGIDNIVELSKNWTVLHQDFPELYSVIQKLKSDEVSIKIAEIIK